jgi:hypothetical protein
MHEIGCLARLPPNPALQRTPLCVDRDRSFFEIWIQLDGSTDPEVRRR